MSSLYRLLNVLHTVWWMFEQTFYLLFILRRHFLFWGKYSAEKHYLLLEGCSFQLNSWPSYSQFSAEYDWCSGFFRVCPGLILLFSIFSLFLESKYFIYQKKRQFLWKGKNVKCLKSCSYLNHFRLLTVRSLCLGRCTVKNCSLRPLSRLYVDIQSCLAAEPPFIVWLD